MWQTSKWNRTQIIENPTTQNVKKKKIKMGQKTKTQMWQKSKTQNVTFKKIKTWQNSKCDKTQKLKMWRN